MELLLKHERKIKQQVREYNSIHGTRLTMRGWIEILTELGTDEIARQRHYLHSGLLAKQQTEVLK